MLLLSGFNTPSFAWPSMSITGYDNSACKALLNMSISCNLKQIGEQSTEGTSILDFVSEHLADTGYTCEVTDGTSSHKAVLVPLSLDVTKSHIIYSDFLDFSRAHDASLTDPVACSLPRFEQLRAFSDVNVLVTYFENTVQTCINRYVPLRIKENNTKILWITRNI